MLILILNGDIKNIETFKGSKLQENKWEGGEEKAKVIGKRMELIKKIFRNTIKIKKIKRQLIGHGLNHLHVSTNLNSERMN